MQHIALAQAAQHISSGRLPQAVAILRRALEKDPANSELLGQLADVLIAMGQLAQATFLLERAVKLAPTNAGVLMLAGDLETRGGKHAAAIALYERAHKAAPDDIAPLRARCIALYESARYDEAMASARNVYDDRPDDRQAHALYSGMCEFTGNLDELVRVLRAAEARWPDDPAVIFALLLPLARVDGLDPRELFRYHEKLGGLMMEQARKNPQALARPHANKPDPERPLRIGYCSQDFRNRSAGHFIEPIIQAHDKSQFEISLFHEVMEEDELTARVAKIAKHIINVSTLDDAQMAETIRDSGIDILVDLSGHTVRSRLAPFALKPAPLQYTYMGYPNTTGLPTIDYRIVDKYTDPEGSDHLATEKLVRMEGSFLCYAPPPHASEPAAAPGVGQQPVTFGSFNTLTKVTGNVLETWAKVLRAVPSSRLLLKAMALSVPAAQERIWAKLESLGIKRERVMLMGETKEKGAHLATYSKVDIALDTWPYNGTTTTVEAMYMGVPVVTIAGNSHVSRVGVSLLSNIGLPELVARDPDEYVAVCSALASDEARRVDLRTRLRPAVTQSPLCDREGFTRRLEGHYRQAWREWCERKHRDPTL